MSLSYKTFRILNKLAGLGVPYETALENLAAEPYLDNKINLKFILFKNFYFGSIQHSLYFIWQGLLLLKISLRSNSKLKQELWNQENIENQITNSNHLITDLLNIHVNNCIHQRINDGNGPIEIIYGIHQELEFLDISITEFFWGIKLQKWKLKYENLSLNPGLGKITNELNSTENNYLHLKISSIKQVSPTFLIYSSKNSQNLSPLNPFITTNINFLTITPDQKQKFRSTVKSFQTHENILLCRKWIKLLKNFLITGYFVNYKTYHLLETLGFMRNFSEINNSKILKNINQDLYFSIPLYSNLTYSQFNPITILNGNINYGSLFQAVLNIQETFSKEEIEQCFDKLTKIKQEPKVIRKNQSFDFFNIILTYFAIRYPFLTTEFLYIVVTLTIFEKATGLNFPTNLPLLQSKITKTGLIKKKIESSGDVKINSSEYLWEQKSTSKIKFSKNYPSKPKGIWNSITTYQQVRKQYIFVYQILETYEEKLELEKAFANVVIQLEQNISQSLSDFFLTGSTDLSSQNSQSVKLLFEKEFKLIDIDLEIFFLQKTLQKYLSNMV